MFHVAKWWVAAFLAAFASMAILDQVRGLDSEASLEIGKAEGQVGDGLKIVIEPANDGDEDPDEYEDPDEAGAGEASPSQPTDRADAVENSPGVSVRTASGVSGATTNKDGVGILVEAPPFSLVAIANAPLLVARNAPSADADVLGQFANPIPSGAPLVFQTERSGTSAPAEWIEVKLPIRPNGTVGWVPRAEVDLVDNPFRIEIDRSTYLLRVFEQNEMIVETIIAVGTGATPTPVGDFYLTELLAPPDPDGLYGPFAFGLSGFSETLATYGGADVAIIGLHGTNDPLSLGTDVSHGCVRIANDVITELAETLPLGTPVQIT